jgi:Ferritin-like domain
MMSDVPNYLEKAIDAEHADQPAHTRKQLLKGAAATVGSLGVLGALPAVARASHGGPNSTQNILNVAASAEVLATIVNTVGWERHLGGDAVTQRNIKAAAREELIHYRKLVSYGGKAASKRIWIPDAVFASRRNFLNTLQVGDDIFVRAYLVATEAFGHRGQGVLAITAAQFMGVEAVHRALARQSLGLLGNDRVFMPEHQRETAPGSPVQGQAIGFESILVAVRRLQDAGFGFGEPGARPGRFYNFDTVKERTPTDPDLNTFTTDLDGES